MFESIEMQQYFYMPLDGDDYSFTVQTFFFFGHNNLSLHSFEHEAMVFVFSLFFEQLLLHFSKRCVPSDHTNTLLMYCFLSNKGIFLMCPFVCLFVIGVC